MLPGSTLSALQGFVVLTRPDWGSLQMAVAKREEGEILQRCKARLEHLVQALPQQDPLEQTRPRLDHLLVDHMLRSSCLKSANALAAATHCQVRLEHDAPSLLDCDSPRPLRTP